jgi:hypothetical protein
MVHAKTENELNEVINKIAGISGCKEFLILKTLKELKKTSPIYIGR